MIKEDDILLFNQLVETSEDSFGKLKEAYEKKDPEKLNKIKKLMLQTQREISGGTK